MRSSEIFRASGVAFVCFFVIYLSSSLMGMPPQEVVTTTVQETTRPPETTNSVPCTPTSCPPSNCDESPAVETKSQAAGIPFEYTLPGRLVEAVKIVAEHKRAGVYEQLICPLDQYIGSRGGKPVLQAVTSVDALRCVATIVPLSLLLLLVLVLMRVLLRVLLPHVTPPHLVIAILLSFLASLVIAAYCVCLLKLVYTTQKEVRMGRRKSSVWTRRRREKNHKNVVNISSSLY
jgi:hypothetical protein